MKCVKRSICSMQLPINNTFSRTRQREPGGSPQPVFRPFDTHPHDGRALCHVECTHGHVKSVDNPHVFDPSTVEAAAEFNQRVAHFESIPCFSKIILGHLKREASIFCIEHSARSNSTREVFTSKSSRKLLLSFVRYNKRLGLRNYRLEITKNKTLMRYDTYQS